MKLTELEFFLEDFLIYCQSKNLAPKTLSSYEQSLKLFIVYLKNEHEIDDPKYVKAGHIRQYVKFVQETGKYTVVVNDKRRRINHPQNSTDYKKTVSNYNVLIQNTEDFLCNLIITGLLFCVKGRRVMN